MKRVLQYTFVFIAGLFFLWTTCLAKEQNSGKLESVEFLSGYGYTKLMHEGNYRIVPFFAGFNYDIKPLSRKMGLHLPGLIKFVIEPFVSYIFEPQKNIEVGNNFAVKIGILDEGKIFQPYFKIGAGVVYFTEHVRQQSTQLNFTEYAGLGMNYSLTKNTAFTIEYRFRHISNANIKRPNLGLGTHIGLFGITYFF